MPLSEVFVIRCIQFADYQLSSSLNILIAKLQLYILTHSAHGKPRDSDFMCGELPSLGDFIYIIRQARDPEYTEDELRTVTLREAAVEMLHHEFAWITDHDIGWVDGKNTPTEFRTRLTSLIHSSLSQDAAKLCEEIARLRDDIDRARR